MDYSDSDRRWYLPQISPGRLSWRRFWATRPSRYRPWPGFVVRSICLQTKARRAKDRPVTADEAVRKTRAHIEGQFPKTCPTCHKVFSTLADYLIGTEHIGPPVSYDAEEGDWTPKMPLGTMSMANCSCGTTMTISSGGMSIWTLWRLMRWARDESHRRGITMEQLLTWVRAQIDEQVLGERRAAEQKVIP